MIREIIRIDEEKCDGCGLCIPGCPEGALQVIDGKARLVSDLMCDGLGACIGECPQGAIAIEKREAEPYNETKVIEVIAGQGRNTTLAHLKHLKEHGETTYLNEAITWLDTHRSGIRFDVKELLASLNNGGSSISHVQPLTQTDMKEHTHGGHACGCQGAATMDLRDKQPASGTDTETGGARPSQLRQWPIQMHLVNPMAPYFMNADLLLVADCVAFASGDFHRDYMKGKSIGIACPKLDQYQEVYVDKLISMIDQAKINTLTVMIMEVPCCRGLLQMAQAAVQKAGRKVPVKMIRMGIQGNMLEEEWV